MAKPEGCPGRRSSVFASRELGELEGSCAALGGRKEELATGSELLGSVECIILEPVGKKLAPDKYVTTGVVVCLQGMLSTLESLDEWGNAAKHAGWLEIGATVVLPNLEMSPSLQLDDIATVIWAALELASFDRCVIAGKDWGAQCAIQLACHDSLKQRVVGVVLLGPDSPPCVACSELEVPACLIWAQDDDVSPFDDLDEWIEALDGRCAPTTVKECESGGHRIDAALDNSNEGVAEAVRKFTVTSLLIADLNVEETANDSDLSPLPSTHNVDERISRLSGELPPSLVSDDGGAGLTSAQNANRRRKSHDLESWIQSGMATASE